MLYVTVLFTTPELIRAITLKIHAETTVTFVTISVTTLEIYACDKNIETTAIVKSRLVLLDFPLHLMLDNF